MHDLIAEYFKYWGKADRSDPTKYHLLPYHCLDVAAVASVWWEQSPATRNTFTYTPGLNEEKTRAWILFFIALHDIGKYDIRFQRKAPHIWQLLQQPKMSTRLSSADSQRYYHGPAGLYWLQIEFEEIILGEHTRGSLDSEDLFDFSWNDNEKNSLWQSWKPWLEAVTGHHGHIIAAENTAASPLPSDCPKNYSITDRNARKSWIVKLESIFLKPAGLSLQEIPPLLSATSFFAGYCSVSDWLGSANSEKRFSHWNSPSDLQGYFEQRHKDASEALQIAGLLGKTKPYEGVQALLNKEHRPHQIQTVVDELTDAGGMTLIEAPTGSGKTEAALAYAWQLLNSDQAESIVFALPTQATANAMLGRLQNLSIKLFDKHPNLLLAHGSALFNAEFVKLRELGKSAQRDEEEAWAQCSDWLSQSRKRAFLGQIGVSTIDQVLTSVLPVMHRFIRGFGLGRSVVIVDEVHAYDTYMYGLLKAVLKEQKDAGGSVILLSATLPHCQRQELFQAWGSEIPTHLEPEKLPYPLISQAASQFYREYQPASDDMPNKKSVFIEPLVVRDCLPSLELIRRIKNAAELGATVALICNLVDVAQKLFNDISCNTAVPVMLFHSRFTLEDRQKIEKDLLNRFGYGAERSRGAILIATQVVEQSLDVDFDWMITQLCPVDLLFQRLGRLHRHAHKDSNRPSGFKFPLCSVLLPVGFDYGLHGLIYANTRVMWRTAYKIEQLGSEPLIFPDAYRSWVESVYSEQAWGNEPEEVEDRYMKFLDEHQLSQRYSAQLMLNSTKNMTPLLDDDQRIAAVTRDGQMSLTLIPFRQTSNGALLRNNCCWDLLDQIHRPEVLAMNRVPVPHTWQSVLDKYVQQKEGIYWLAMDADGDMWHSQLGPWELRYNKDVGMERIK